MQILGLLLAVAFIPLLTAPFLLCQPLPLPSRPSPPPSTTTTAFNVHSRVRQQWRHIQSICPDRSFRSCNGADRTAWTHAASTQLSTLAPRGTGAWSSFKLQTHDSKGRPQTSGGDSWVVSLREPALGITVASRVFDEADGSYTVAAFIHEPGSYSVLARLYYSKCLALQEPSGTAGEMDLTEPDHCFIGDEVEFPGALTVQQEQGPSPTPQPPLRPSCASAPHPQRPPPDPQPADALVWNTDEYYLWRHNGLEAQLCFRAPAQQGSRPVSRLFYYGDSTVRDMWSVMLGLARERPCKVNLRPDPARDAVLLRHGLHGMMFNASVCPPAESWAQVDPEMDSVLRRCTGGMPWASVPVGTNYLGISLTYPTSLLMQNVGRYRYDDRYERALDPPVGRPATARHFSLIFVDHHDCRQADHVLKDLRHLRLRRGDAVLMNMGAWCFPSVTFAQWAARIDAIAAGIAALTSKTGALMIWRTSLVLKEHMFRRVKGNAVGGYLAGGMHFMTDMRRLEFDSYAMHALSGAGMQIWDVHALSALGLNKAQDMVHASQPTGWVMNKDLLDALICPI